jgi:hypothetical protein
MSSNPLSDSIVPVTGVNGFLGSHMAIIKKHRQGRFEVISVADITIDRTFDEAVKGIKQPHR